MPKGSGHASPFAPDNLSKPVNRKGRKVHIEKFFAFYAFFVVKFFSPSFAPLRSFNVAQGMLCGKILLGLIGNVNVNLLPLPTSLSTQIFPPCNSTNFLASVNPSPVPSTL